MDPTEATLRIARTIDATYLPALGQELSEDEVRETIVYRVIAKHFGCLCIDPLILHSFPKLLRGAADISGFRLCTVVDFPNGKLSLTKRLNELTKAIDAGVDEVDVVIPVYAFYGGKANEVKRDLSLITNIASNPGQGRAPVLVKVILETGYWDKQQLVELVQLLNEVPDIAYYKTSTGREPKVPIVEKVDHIKIIRAHTDRMIKASGGLRSLGDYLMAESAGATRFGVGLDAADNIIDEVANSDT